MVEILFIDKAVSVIVGRVLKVVLTDFLLKDTLQLNMHWAEKS